MKLLKNFFMIMGLFVTLGIGFVISQVDITGTIDKIKKFDPKAKDVYINMAKVLIETGDIAQATIRRVKILDDVTTEEVEETLINIATERGIKPVGVLPLSKEVEARTGKKQRYINIMSFCNPVIATKMIDYSLAFGACLPCQIAVVEAKDGSRWLYTLDMDMMIHGGVKLPPELLKMALSVKDTMYTMMDKAAAGEF